MNPTVRLVLDYVDSLLIIVGTWFTTIMVVSGAHFADLVHEASLIALAITVVAWLIRTAQKFLDTGALEPAPVTGRDPVPAPPAPLPPQPPPATASSVQYPPFSPVLPPGTAATVRTTTGGG